MHKILNTAISRRSLLKLGGMSGALLTLPLWNSGAIAQSASNVTSKVVEVKPEGLVSFNAGWAIPLEDKPALLVLEEKKIQEAKAATPATSTSNVDALAKPANKNWADKAQDALNKVKNFFK